MYAGRCKAGAKLGTVECEPPVLLLEVNDACVPAGLALNRYPLPAKGQIAVATATIYSPPNDYGVSIIGLIDGVLNCRQ